jgi:hypothetical protein
MKTDDTGFQFDVFFSHSAKDKAMVRALMERTQADGMNRMPSSGLDFDNMPEDQKWVINNLPAMLYHGLPRRSGCAKTGDNTEADVLMRMNAVSRSIATGLCEKYAAAAKESADLHSRDCIANEDAAESLTIK